MTDTEYHKTTINIPIDIYNELKRESKVLGINFNALILIKLQELQKQNDTLKLLKSALSEASKNDN